MAVLNIFISHASPENSAYEPFVAVLDKEMG